MIIIKKMIILIFDCSFDITNITVAILAQAATMAHADVSLITLRVEGVNYLMLIAYSVAVANVKAAFNEKYAAITDAFKKYKAAVEQYKNFSNQRNTTGIESVKCSINEALRDFKAAEVSAVDAAEILTKLLEPNQEYEVVMDQYEKALEILCRHEPPSIEDSYIFLSAHLRHYNAIRKLRKIPFMIEYVLEEYCKLS